jgi:hypothetical protein
MRPFTSSIVGLAVIVIVLATGCVGRGADGASALPRPEGPASANGADLAGTWRGSFGQVMTGDSGWVRGDILTQIKSDGTYTTTWTTLLVAGSSRGGKLEMTGTVVANGSRVMFNDARSGARMTLTRDGDTLYGVTIDPGTRRVYVAVDLHKVQAAPEAP